ncbi:MAG: restriction endonuclease [Microbacteriaceae bacterium]|nr:restriction endonuclease [Microbacteriaceae bacterium]
MNEGALDAGREDQALRKVCAKILELDASGERFAQVFRETFDQLYDGQRTGRYKWEQLFKTEKTHFGTLIEINIQREFGFSDGVVLDFEIAGEEIDCKYSFREGGWMLPPESWGRLVLVATASDSESHWSLGVVRVLEQYLRDGRNRDGKSGLNEQGRQAITWLFRHVSFPPNVLLKLSSEDVDEIFSKSSGQTRLNELFRRAEGMRIHRNAIATVAQQQDFMKRVRSNGGSRSILRSEGYLILGGDYLPQRELATRFALPTPLPGEFVSIRVVPTAINDPAGVEIGQSVWRRAMPHEQVTIAAPDLT